MTTVYMVCNSECENLQDLSSDFSDTGIQEQKLIEEFFKDKKIDAIYVSALKSAAETMRFLTKQDDIHTTVVEEFNERKIGPRVTNLESFSKRQWAEPTYELPEGESFLKVQDRMIDGLERVVTDAKNRCSIIASHSMAIGTVIQFFDETFDFEEYWRTTTIHPWIVKMEFEEKTLVSLEEIRCI